MSLQTQIELITVPQDFVRLCNAILLMENGDDFLPIDDDRADGGNDGYIKSQKQLFAAHCFKRIQNKGIDRAISSKMLGDLNKAIKLKLEKKWDIERWTFLCNYPINETIARRVFQTGKDAGIDVSWRGPEYFTAQLYKFKALVVEFPGLQLNEVSDQLGEILKKLETVQKEDNKDSFLGIPSNDSERNILLRTMPKGWQYLLLAGFIRHKKEELELRWHDYQVGYAPPNGKHFNEQRTVSYIVERLSDLNALSKGMMLLFTKEQQKIIFNDNSDVKRIEHFASRVGSGYGDMLDWASDMRGINVPESMTRIVSLAAQLVDQPTKDVRKFMDDILEGGQKIIEFHTTAKGKDLNIELILKLTADQELVRAFKEENSSLQRTIKQKHLRNWLNT